MTAFAEVPQDQRRTAIDEAAARLGIVPVIVEKDYWVCWLLGRIFEAARWSSQFVFKGGASLSKVFGIIDRFSEDIDLSVAGGSGFQGGNSRGRALEGEAGEALREPSGRMCHLR